MQQFNEKSIRRCSACILTKCVCTNRWCLFSYPQNNWLAFFRCDRIFSRFSTSSISSNDLRFFPCWLSCWALEERADAMVAVLPCWTFPFALPFLPSLPIHDFDFARDAMMEYVNPTTPISYHLDKQLQIWNNCYQLWITYLREFLVSLTRLLMI